MIARNTQYYVLNDSRRSTVIIFSLLFGENLKNNVLAGYEIDRWLEYGAWERVLHGAALPNLDKWRPLLALM